MEIQGIRPDILILELNTLLISVVDIMKSGNSILEDPNVLGELFDQMNLLQPFYGMGPTLGILATGKQFLVGWFLQDLETFSMPPLDIKMRATPKHVAGNKVDEIGPAGSTPSQKNTAIFSVEDEEINSTTETIEQHGNIVKLDERRLLYCTPVMTANDNIPKLMGILSTALIRVTHAKPSYYLLFDSTRGFRQACCDDQSQRLHSIKQIP